jgi:stress response protein YsnF
MAQTVIGFFDSANEAREACEMLKRQGFTDGQIDLRTNSSAGGNEQLIGGQKMDDTGRRDQSDESESGITRFFKNLFGGDDDEADRYTRVGSSSGAIVTVHANSGDEAERAADILDENGAVDVDERSAQYASTSSMSSGSSLRSDDSSLRGSDMDQRNRTDLRTGMDDSSQSLRGDLTDHQQTSGRSDETIQRVEENLEVGKREVERGSTRIRSRIVERPVEEHVRLREEHVHIERTAVDRPVTGERNDLFQEKDIELTERAEVPVVNKEARVVEEIRISKDVDERDETIRDTVRNTEIDIDQDNDRNLRSGRTGNDTNLRSTDL